MAKIITLEPAAYAALQAAGIDMSGYRVKPGQTVSPKGEVLTWLKRSQGERQTDFVTSTASPSSAFRALLLDRINDLLSNVNPSRKGYDADEAMAILAPIFGARASVESTARALVSAIRMIPSALPSADSTDPTDPTADPTADQTAS